MKKSYMVAVQKKVVLYPTIYAEVISKNKSEAIKMAKKIKLKDEDFIEEIKIDSADVCTLPKKAKYIFEGEAKQHHSSSGCCVCSELELKQELKKERKNLRSMLRPREPNPIELEEQQKRISEIICKLNDWGVKVKRSKYE